MTSTARWPLLLTALLAVFLTACAAEPSNEATPGFATDAEAFEAAEKTYRAYVDALNARRADSSAPDPQDYLIGEALELDIGTHTTLTERGTRIVGPTEVVGVSRIDRPDPSRTRVAVCIDSKKTRVLDASDRDVTPSDRTTRLPLVITTVILHGETLIANSESGSAETC